jgi:hypothetical protein
MLKKPIVHEHPRRNGIEAGLNRNRYEHSTWLMQKRCGRRLVAD